MPHGIESALKSLESMVPEQYAQGFQIGEAEYSMQSMLESLRKAEEDRRFEVAELAHDSTEHLAAISRNMAASAERFADRVADEVERRRERAALDPVDDRILAALEMLAIEGPARSYRQAALDLDGEERISWRGTVADLREALREVLDFLAPDAQVMGQPGFRRSLVSMGRR